MIDHGEAAREGRVPVRRARPHLAVLGAPPVTRTPRTSAAAAAEHAAEWAEGLAALVRAEIDDAVRCGVISAGEADQLLARLVLVVDQAVVSRGAP